MTTQQQNLHRLAFEECEAAMHEYVRHGAELLDVEIPGWAERIDLDCLHLRDFEHGVLGQLYGSYERCVRALRMTLKAIGGDDGYAGRFGFTTHARTSRVLDDNQVEELWARLDDVWADQVLRRRSATTVHVRGSYSRNATLPDGSEDE